MPATVTLKQCKKQISQLPRKQRTALAENILQEEYESECLEKVDQTYKTFKAEKGKAIPHVKAMQEFKAYSKGLDRK